MNSPKSQSVLTLSREDWKRLREALEHYNMANERWPKLRLLREKNEIIVRLGDRENAVTWTITHSRTSN